MKKIIIPVITPLVAIISFILLSSIGLIISLFSRKGEDALHILGRIWARIIFSCAGIKMTVTGQENILKDEPVVFASNHQSQFDILALYLALPVQFRFVVKKELFNIPFFGLAMKKTGYVPIDRSGGKRALKSLREAVRRLTDGKRLVVFPEGTRSKDGRLLPFKAGALLIAHKAKVKIIPVGIKGTKDALPKGSLWIRPATVEVNIGRPIDTSEFCRSSWKEDLTEAVREEVKRLID